MLFRHLYRPFAFAIACSMMPFGARTADAQASPEPAKPVRADPGMTPALEAAPAISPASAPPDPRPLLPLIGPVIDLPPSAADTPSATVAPLGFTGTAIGGYGELTLNAPSNGPAIVDLRRFVLFFGHNFTDKIRMYSEVEVEHAIASSDDRGEVEIEQAYLDGLLHASFNLRAGVILMPAGIINVHHEPPSFNGVDRPDVDEFVIPTTWREAGLGAFGQLVPELRYQAYFVTGFDANGFSAEAAIRDGHQEAQLALAGNFGAIARLDYEPVLGSVVGVTAYASKSGAALHGVGSVPLGLIEIDARTRLGGFSARAEAALLTIGDAAALSRALAAGTPEQATAGPISSRAYGGYVEAAYDVLQPLRLQTEQGLSVFGRVEFADTQASVPRGFDARKEYRRYSCLLGLVWRPIQQIAIKADYRRRESGTGHGFNVYSTAFTWLF